MKKMLLIAICMIVLFACKSTGSDRNVVNTPQVVFSSDSLQIIEGANGVPYIVNINGDTIIPPQYKDLDICGQIIDVTNADGMSAAFDHQGKRLTDFAFDYFKEFTKVFVAYKGEDKYVFDYSGKSILPTPAKDLDVQEEFTYPNDFLGEPQYKETLVFYKTEYWGMVAVEGHTRIANVYDNLFSHGEYYLGYKSQKYHALDKNGDVATAYYDDIEPVEGGFIVGNNGNYGYISKNNKILLDMKYWLINNIDDNKLIVYETPTKCGLYSQTGKKLLPTIYEYLWEADFENDYLYAKINGKIGIWSNNHFIIRPEYDDIYFLRTIDRNYWSVVKNGKHGLLYEDGRTLLPIKYTSISRHFQQKHGQKFDFVVGINDRFQIHSIDGKLKDTRKTAFFDIDDGELVSWQEVKSDSLFYDNAYVYDVHFSRTRK